MSVVLVKFSQIMTKKYDFAGKMCTTKPHNFATGQVFT